MARLLLEFGNGVKRMLVEACVCWCDVGGGVGSLLKIYFIDGDCRIDVHYIR